MKFYCGFIRYSGKNILKNYICENIFLEAIFDQVILLASEIEQRILFGKYIFTLHF